MTRAVTTCLAFFAVLASACGGPAPLGAGEITGTAKAFTVQGKFSPAGVDTIVSLSLDGGKLVIHGDTKSATFDIPAGGDASKPEPHWSLTSENEDGPIHKASFTHNESLEELTLSLPHGVENIHYGTLRSQTGDAVVMLLAWNIDAQGYWGYVTITPNGGAGAAGAPPSGT